MLVVTVWCQLLSRGLPMTKPGQCCNWNSVAGQSTFTLTFRRLCIRHCLVRHRRAGSLVRLFGGGFRIV
jgi:hypothetical protein